MFPTVSLCEFETILYTNKEIQVKNNFNYIY